MKRPTVLTLAIKMLSNSLRVIVLWPDKTARGEGRLLEFGHDYVELQNGAGQFPVGIIVLDDGSFIAAPLDRIKWK